MDGVRLRRGQRLLDRLGLAKTPIDGGPTQLLGSQLWCYGIAVDAQNAYCSSSSGLLRVPMGGGTPVTLIPPVRGDSVGNPGEVVVNAGTVYWTDGEGLIESLPSSGGPPTRDVGYDGASADLAINASAIYWLTTKGIGYAPLSGGTESGVVIPMGPVQHMTVDDTSVYWTSASGGTVMRLTPK